MRARNGSEKGARRQRRRDIEALKKDLQKIIGVVERRVRHLLYGKIVTRSAKYHAHIENGLVAQDDLVEIEECRPISRTNTWRVTQVVEKAHVIRAVSRMK
ncbi:MAG: 30S ribosomal protein S17 [Azoarcus sp.]|jgi:small subunit ribosomal protein S17|nr:30S ribosomal protein S17 [Azoarcus sp.]